MAKKSNSKNIIVTNLPAAAALLLMAAALKLTLHYSFFISLIVLVIVYFLLGVTIELILEKADAKKKRENLYKQFSEGGRSNLPTGRRELYAEPEFEEPVFPIQSEIEDLDMERKPLDEADDMTEFEDKSEESFDDFAENVIEETNSEDSIEECVDETYNLADDVDDDFLNVAMKKLMDEEASEKEIDDLDKFFAGAFGDGDNSVSVEVVEPESADESDAEVIAVEEIAVDEGNESSEDESAEEFTLNDIPVDENIVEEPAAEVFVEDVSDTEEVEQAIEPEVMEINEDLYEALKEVGAIPEEPEDETPAEEKDARRSLFEGSAFDAEDISGGKPSVIFGSVPDTEDDLEYIPPVIDSPAIPKKGKVQVDSQKIDELYAFKKASAGESFFGRRRKK